jgi:hypothetical protein
MYVAGIETNAQHCYMRFNNYWTSPIKFPWYHLKTKGYNFVCAFLILITDIRTAHYKTKEKKHIFLMLRTWFFTKLFTFLAMEHNISKNKTCL